jgi:hypothetical protein
MLRRGIIDETQALILFETFLLNKESSINITLYSLQNDFYVFYGLIPIVYMLHLMFLFLMFSIS